jgi:hypothetical protein
MSLWRQLLGITVLASMSAPACAAPVEEPAGPGGIAIEVRYEKPAPGRPLSIGGYAVFATLKAPDGKVVGGGELETSNLYSELAPGDYVIDVRLAPASDAILMLPNGDSRREFGPTSARCDGTIRVTADSNTDVAITAFGGDACAIGPR